MLMSAFNGERLVTLQPLYSLRFSVLRNTVLADT